MAIARCWSVALVGITPHVVEVEVDVATGLPEFILSALADKVLGQVKHRLRSAVTNSGETWPAHKVTVALLPAAVPKTGSSYDLPIALAALAAAGSLPVSEVGDWVALGALSLTGAVKPVAGVLPAVAGAYRAGCRRFIVPAANYREAQLVPGAEVVGVESLADVCAWMRGDAPAPWPPADDDAFEHVADEADLADVVGQPAARRALEVAAAGGHHLFLVGPPGVGKTMLAERLPSLLPDLTEDESLEVTMIHSVAAVLTPGRPLISRPPFCAPHHSATTAAIVGGGAGLAGPGAISLAHHGVLFLDEAPEYPARTLDALRQPLESGIVSLARAAGVATYPCRFQLVLAANPCPCSAAGAPTGAARCTCGGAARQRYLSKLSGPLMDRVDVRVEFEEVSRAVLETRAQGEPTAVVRQRVLAARERARERLIGTRWATNADVPGPVVRRRWPISREAMRPLFLQVDRGTISTRGVDRVLKLAWTLADLAQLERPGVDEVLEASALRGGYNVTTMAVPA